MAFALAFIGGAVSKFVTTPSWAREHGADHQYFECAHSGHGLQNDNAVYRRWIEAAEAYLDKYMPVDRGESKG